jgi:flagella basal body P-ring formation protein FlgA
VPDDPLTVRVLDVPTTGVSPNFIIRFDLLTPYETIGRWQMPLRARVWRTVPVCRSALQRGQPLEEAGLASERRDVLALREALFNPAAGLSSFEVAESVPAGTPLYARSVRLRTLVRRGQMAEAILREGARAVSLKVEVLEDGALGQQVRVRNPQSKREFRGKVQNEQTVLVAL